jgi:DNA-binding CsgD family transcriptional regulator
MQYKLFIPAELVLTGMQFFSLWLIFYQLFRPESKGKRIALLSVMVLWRSLHIIAFMFFTFSTPVKIILQALMFLSLVFLSEGKKQNRFISAIYLWNIGLLINTAFSCVFTGITGNLTSENMQSLYFEMIITQLAMLLWSAFYYVIMRSISNDALNRVALRFWLIALITPFLGAAALFAVINPLKIQLEAGFNNFLFCGIFGLVLLILNLSIFYLYIKLICEHHSPLLAGELAKTPPLYTVSSGLSAAFIEKYNLSKRQIEITEALLQGKTNKDIAVQCNIEVNTVQVHLQNIYKKTGAPGRYAIMSLAGLGDNAQKN